MPDFQKVVAGDPGYLADWPQACICGAQTGPMVATGITYRAAGAGDTHAHVYLCRLCVTRAGRALGLVKGEEMTRLQNAADELAQAESEVNDRQAIIERLTKTAGENEAKIGSQRQYIETLQAEITQYRHLANQVKALSSEMAAA